MPYQPGPSDPVGKENIQTPGSRSWSLDFSHPAVLLSRRDTPVSVWGTAAAGEQVTVEFVGQKKTVAADAHGNWLVRLVSPRAIRMAYPSKDGLMWECQKTNQIDL